MAESAIVTTGGCYDCGGRCVHRVHVRDGIVTRIETDGGDEPQLRSCLRGRALRKRLYSPDRLVYPMKRLGERGEGKFARISWDEALDTVAGALENTKKTYGPSAVLYVDGTGAQGHLHHPAMMARLFNEFGGYTYRWGSASSEGSRFASKATYGAFGIGHTRDDLVNSRLIVMWGWNPAVTIHGTNTTLHLARAREAGARVICVDPRFHDTAAAFADRWVPLRPGTDVAAMVAMAYVMITRGLHDQRFLDRYTSGFPVFRDYVLGKEDGLPKTPEWAAAITGIPAAAIERLAQEYATIKPAALMTGLGPGRSALGEQFHRAAATLAAMTGNIGIPGGEPAGFAATPNLAFPAGKNPVEAGFSQLGGSLDSKLKSKIRVHTTRIWDAILEGRAAGYPADFKLMYTVASNCLNQFLNTNKAIAALGKLEFIAVQEQVMTPTARYADILLPACTHLEHDDLYCPVYPGLSYIYARKTVEPLGESKSDYEIALSLARRLKINAYEDKTEADWLRALVKRYDEARRDLPDFDSFRETGVNKEPLKKTVIPFEDQVRDPENNPFPTPSGKIEIYSRLIAELNDPAIPPIPKYRESWEGRNDPLAKEFPLQLITTHAKRRANSAFEGITWLEELDPQGVLMNPADASPRGISHGDRVRVFNRRGETYTIARVTERITPGVVDLSEGAAFTPDERGIDRNGSPNLLTRDEPSPGGAFSCNTCLVQISKA
ncbi:MAG: molybdopterin-dependent oxidoreductase [Chloroflexi bacterium]|nr:molybdopterin-dependent oxidoreductase [Chloroflexota bacterium]